MTLVADRNLGRVMEMLTMKGKKQDDKEKGGGERENGHMKQLWVDLKDSSEVDNLKKN